MGREACTSCGWYYTSPGLYIFFFPPNFLQTKHGRNLEKEQEKKKEQETWEKKVGILQYLGQTVADRGGSKPWYEMTAEAAAAAASSGKSLEKRELERSQQAEMDPMRSAEVRREFLFFFFFFFEDQVRSDIMESTFFADGRCPNFAILTATTEKTPAP